MEPTNCIAIGQAIINLPKIQGKIQILLNAFKSQAVLFQLCDPYHLSIFWDDVGESFCILKPRLLPSFFIAQMIVLITL